MHIQITNPFYDRALSPLAFQQNEMLEVPDDVAQKLIASGHAKPVDAITDKAPAKRKRKETR